jgi:hypothetical protein
VIGEETPSRTRDFSRSQFAAFSARIKSFNLRLIGPYR